MTLQPSRRGFITGLIAFAAVPAIVRASSLMRVKAMLPQSNVFEFGGGPCNSSLWLVRWGEHTIYQTFPEDWRHAARCADIEIDTINT